MITQIKHSLRHVCVQSCLCYIKLHFKYSGIAGLIETMNALRKEKDNIKLEAASKKKLSNRPFSEIFR